jgi:hypothetical protein
MKKPAPWKFDKATEEEQRQCLRGGFTAAVVQGLLAGKWFDCVTTIDPWEKVVAKRAVTIADALIAELEK